MYVAMFKVLNLALGFASLSDQVYGTFFTSFIATFNFFPVS